MPVKISLIISLSLLFAVGITDAASFKEEQLRFERVRKAYADKEGLIQGLLEGHGLSFATLKLYLRLFKKERLIEAWALKKDKYILLKTFPFAAFSGNLGPKNRQGDSQIPEGFYVISAFNPVSNFYLSLRISYPNAADLARGDGENPGGDIYIHGNSVTIGCIPITDEGIKQLYLLAVEARSHGQLTIPVHCFPARLDQGGMMLLRKEYAENVELLDFWLNLQQGFDYFERFKIPPVMVPAHNGRYALRKGG